MTSRFASSETDKNVSQQIVVAAFYKFTPLVDFESYKAPLLHACQAAEIRGTILLAHEGINGTIAGRSAQIEIALSHIRQIPGCADIEHKRSYANENPFLRMKVRLKREIVTMGMPEVDPNKAVGTYIDPKDWDALISDPDVILIDTRNDYEVSIGSFQRAINPGTTTFRDFPSWFDRHPDIRNAALNGKKVAMFCTGGIRCEKASSFLKLQGIEEVYHLKGGILKYLETVPEGEGRWEGECFVFDERVSVKQGLEQGSFEQCRACRMPVGVEDKASEKYVPGVSCPKCYDARDADQKQRYLERQKQVELANRRGEVHVGKIYPDQIEASPKIDLHSLIKSEDC